MEMAVAGANVRDAHEILEFRDEAIWRYMNLAKFISMLDTKSLYFTRLDRFDDRHEGALSAPGFERAVADAMAIMKADEPFSVTQDDARERAALVEAAVTKKKQESILANCWHRNAVESAAMWAKYGSEGVAIRSTIGALYECTKHYRNPGVMIQFVNYIDHDTHDFDPEEAFLFKHRLYSYEQEVRALILLPIGKAGPPGCPVPVDLTNMIHGVHLAPSAGGLQESVVKSLLARYALPNVEVVPSAADTIPEYRKRHDEFLVRLRTEKLDDVIAEHRAALRARYRQTRAETESSIPSNPIVLNDE